MSGEWELVRRNLPHGRHGERNGDSYENFTGLAVFFLMADLLVNGEVCFAYSEKVLDFAGLFSVFYISEVSCFLIT